MALAGGSPRAARRYAAPWWEDLDGEAFRFPTARRPRIVDPVAPDELDADDVAVATMAARAKTADVATAPAARERPRSRPITGDPRPVTRDRRPAVAERPGVAERSGVAKRPGVAERSGVAKRPGVAERSAASGTHPSGAPATDGRRTVVIRGYGAERNLPVARPTLRRHERPGFKPDRAALWAVVLGLFLILVAAASAHAAVVPQLVR